jgi:hypothetical protein
MGDLRVARHAPAEVRPIEALLCYSEFCLCSALTSFAHRRRSVAAEPGLPASSRNVTQGSAEVGGQSR